MILGKWNKSVILTYVGLLFSIIGIYYSIQGKIHYALVCMMIMGLCDLFDGTVARRCKRTKKEKQFGIELDSLVDVFDFIAFPIVYFYMIGFKAWFFIPLLGLYGVFGIARLAHFNTFKENDDKPVVYYHGLPVTYAALFFPVSYLLSFCLSPVLFMTITALLIFIVSILYIVDIKVPKPSLKVSIGLLFLAIVLSILYLFVL